MPASVQAAISGARDLALNTGEPAGIRLLPDPAFPLAYLANGQLDPTQPIAANRILPLAAAPEYSEGLVNTVLPTDQQFIGFSVNPVLMIEENVVQLTTLGRHPK